MADKSRRVEALSPAGVDGCRRGEVVKFIRNHLDVLAVSVRGRKDVIALPRLVQFAPIDGL